MIGKIYTPWLEREHPSGLGGIQKLYAFEGSVYGASVVKNQFSYGGAGGLWELAVLRYTGPLNEKELEFELVYDTPITDDVIGYLTEEEIQAILDKIAHLA